MEILTAELVGTAILVVLGDGVVAGVLLTRSKAQGAGWLVIAAGWGVAVTVAVYAVGTVSGAHINPAVTIGQLVTGLISINDALLYWAGQFIGAFIGAVIVYLHYLSHWAETEDPSLKLAVFSTGPAIRRPLLNVSSEIIATFILVLGVSAILQPNNEVGALGALLVGFLVFGIGISLGGPTGFAINPARDLGPRIAHAVLPIPGKGGSDWSYSWVPVIGPLIGGVLGGLAFQLLFTNFLIGG